MASMADRLAAADKAISGGGPQPTRGNYYWNAAKEGLATGIGNVADVIPRTLQLGKVAAGMAMSPFVSPDALPEVSSEFANSNTESLKRLFGVEQITPTGQGQEIAGGLIRGAASSPIPIGQTGGILAQLLKTMAVGGAGGGGAVAGGQVAESVAPDSPMAKLSGEVLGGLVGGVAAPSAGGIVGIYSRAKQAAMDAKDNPALQGAARTTAEKIIDRQVKDAVSGTPNAGQNITESLRLRERMGPGFNPSVAEMADSPGLTDMQRRFSLTTPKRLNEEVARDVGNVAAVRQFYESQSGQQGKAGAIRSSVNQGISDEADALATAARANAERLPLADQVAIGNRASDLARAEKTAAKPAITAAYEKAFDASGDSRVDISSVISKAEEILGTKLAQIKPDSAPQTVAAIQRLVKSSGDKTKEELEYLSSRLGGTIENPQVGRAQVTLRDIDSIRKAINADVTSAARSSDPIAATRMRNLYQMHEEIDSAVAVSKVPHVAKTYYAQAIEKYRDEFAPRFKEGANLKMFRDTSLNEPRIVADKFVAEYFKPDTQSGAVRGEQFKRLFGQNQEAKNLTREGVLDSYRQKVVNPQTGELDFQAHNRFMRDHQRTIDVFKSGGVNVKDELTSIGNQAGKIASMQEKMASLTKSLKFDTTDDLIEGALGSQKVMGNVLMRLDKGQRENIQRALMDKAWESGTGSGMSKYLSDNEKTLKMALSPTHLADMKDVASALSITERAPVRGVIASGGADVLKRATGVSMATVWSQYRATTGGRQGPMTAVFNLSAPVMTKLSQTNFEDVMQKALHDPETAKALRTFLLASGEPSAAVAANGLLSRIARTVKMGAGVVWDYRGNATRLLSGVENYPQNLGRSAQAISGEVQQQ